jgi:hypothetical protein
MALLLHCVDLCGEFVRISEELRHYCAVLVAALAMLSRYPVMMVLFSPTTELAVPNDCGLALIRSLRSMWAMQYFTATLPTSEIVGEVVPTPEKLQGSGGRQKLGRMPFPGVPHPTLGAFLVRVFHGPPQVLG